MLWNEMIKMLVHKWGLQFMHDQESPQFKGCHLSFPCQPESWSFCTEPCLLLTVLASFVDIQRFHGFPKCFGLCCHSWMISIPLKYVPVSYFNMRGRSRNERSKLAATVYMYIVVCRKLACYFYDYLFSYLSVMFCTSPEINQSTIKIQDRSRSS